MNSDLIMFYTRLLWAKEMASIVDELVSTFVFVFILASLVLGFKRGVLKHGLHLGATLVAAAVAFFSISNFCGGIVTSFSELNAEELKGVIELLFVAQGQAMSPEAYEEILPILNNIDPTGVGLILAIVVNILFAPLLLLAIFYIIRLIAKTIVKISARFISQETNPIEKILGALLGVIDGVVISVIFVIPFLACLNTFSDIAVAINDSTPSKDEINDEYEYEDIELMDQIAQVFKEFSAPIEDNLVLKTVSSLGGDTILESLATVELDGAKVDLRDELQSIVRVACKFVLIQTTVSPEGGYTDYEKEYISGIVDEVDNSTVVSNILYSVLHTYVSIEQSYLDEEIIAEEPFTSVIFDLILNRTNATTIGDNLHTIKNVSFILIDTGFTGDYTILLTTDENGETILNKLVAELENNPNTAHLPDAIAGALMAQMGMGDGKEYNAMKDSFSQIVQIETEGKEKKEVKEEVKDTFVEMFENFDIVVGEEGDVREEDLDTVVNFLTEELMNGNLDIPVDENGHISNIDLMELVINCHNYFNDSGEEVPAE